MATVVQNVPTTSTARTTVNVTLSSTGANAALVAFLTTSAAATDPGTTTVTDNKGNTWVKQTPVTRTSGRYTETFVCTGATGGVTTVTCAGTNSVVCAWDVLEVSGIAVSGTPIDGYLSTMGASTTTPAATQVTPTTSTDFILGMIHWNGNTTAEIPTPSGYTSVSSAPTPSTKIVYISNPTSGVAIGPAFTESGGSSQGYGACTLALKTLSASPTVSIWNGSSEVTGCTMTTWDGTTEHAIGSIAIN